MPNQQLLDYIEFKSKQGVSNEEIKKLLLEAGWKGEDIDNAFVYLDKNNINTITNKISENVDIRKINYSENVSGFILILATGFLSFIFLSTISYRYTYFVVLVFMFTALLYLFFNKKQKINILDQNNTKITLVDKIMSFIYLFLLLILLFVVICSTAYLFVISNSKNSSGLDIIFPLYIMALSIPLLCIFSILGLVGSKKKISNFKTNNLSVPFYFKFLHFVSKYSLLLIGLLVLVLILLRIFIIFI